MKKKISAILTTAIMAMLCLMLLVSCSSRTQAVDFFDYSTSNIGPIGNLIRLMHTNWIGNYGWTVVVFTIFLKLLMLPLDFWQRYSSRKISLKMQKMQPIIEDIDKRYGENTQRANEEKQKLYKKQGYSMLSTCLPMIISMVIFFVMFGGLNNYSRYCTVQTFKVLSNEYYDTYVEQIEKEGGELYQVYLNAYNTERSFQLNGLNLAEGEEPGEKDAAYVELSAKVKGVVEAIKNNKEKCAELETVAIDAVKEVYKNGNPDKGLPQQQEKWLWINSVWQPDTWAAIMPAYDSGANQFKTAVDITSYPCNRGEDTYNIVRNAILETGGYGKNGSWNGLMILPIMSIGLSFLSMWISQRMERKNRKGEAPAENKQQQTTNRMMMFMMPAMMAVFGFMYTGAFAIYMVVNYTLSTISTVALRLPIEKLVEKNLAKSEKKDKSGKASYMR